MADAPTTPSAPAAPTAPATPSPAPSAPVRTPATTPHGARQEALTAADRARRADASPVRRVGDQQPAPDAPRDPARAPTGDPYRDAAPSDEQKIKLADDLEVTPQEFRDMQARAALEASRKLSLPADPSGYEAKMPADFKLPNGVTYEVNERDPMMAKYRDFAHRHGFDQAQFSEGLGLVAMLRAEEALQVRTAFKMETAKLGAAGSNRVDAVVQWLDAYGGPKAKTLTNMLAMAPVADTIEALEHVMQRVSSQGVTPFNAAHRADAPAAGKIPGYENMSFEQRRHAQEQQRARQQGGR